MDKSILSSLSFENYVAEKIEFQINEDFVSNREVELDLKFDRSIEIDLEDCEAIIKLGCRVFEGYKEKNYPFYLEAILRGFFHFNDSLNEEEIKQLLEINGTAILFPYLRTIISNITASSGVPPLVIPTINIVNMIKNEHFKENINK